MAKFNPKKGVGARRWYFLAKSLTQRGICVTVFTGDVCDESIQIFFKDAIERNLFYIRYVNGLNKNGYITNAKIRNYLITLKSLINKEIDIFESWAIRLRNELISYLEEESADIIIASGHPCSLLFQVMPLKPLYNDIFFVCDYRDVWNQEYNYSDTRLIFKSIKKKSLKQEYLTLLSADLVTHVSLGQSLLTQNQFPDLPNKSLKKFQVINNFVVRKNFKSDVNTDICVKYKWLHFGNIRNESLDSFYKFLFLLKNQSNCSEKVHIYGHAPKYRNFKERDLLINNTLNKEVVGVEDQKKVLDSYQNALVFFDKKTGYGTKIFDYIAADVTILAVCDEGELYNLCEFFDIPHISPNQLLKNGIPLRIQKMPNAKRKMFLDKFSIDVVSEKLLNALR